MEKKDILCSVKYTQFNSRQYEIHRMALELVPAFSSVLELGCATGYITKELLKKQCTVTGIDFDKQAIVEAKKTKAAIIWADFNKPETYPKISHADIVLCLDVIEHVIERRAFLAYIRSAVSEHGRLLLSTPNIAHIRIRLQLLRGLFDYEPIGIMDATHVHFYTKKSICEEIEKAGFHITSIQPSVDLGQVPYIGRIARRLPKKIQYGIVSCFPELLAVQWLVTAEKKH